MLDLSRKAVEERVFESLTCRAQLYVDGTVMETECGATHVDSECLRCPRCGKFLFASDDELAKVEEESD